MKNHLPYRLKIRRLKVTKIFTDEFLTDNVYEGLKFKNP